MHMLIGKSLSYALENIDSNKEVVIIRNDSDKLKVWNDDLVVRVQENDTSIRLTVSHFMTKPQ